MNIIHSQNSFRLNAVLNSVQNEPVSFYNVIQTINKEILFGTNKGLVSLERNRFDFVSKKGGFASVDNSGEVISSYDSKKIIKDSRYNFLFGCNYLNQSREHSYVEDQNNLYIISYGVLYIFVKSIFEKTLPLKSVRSFSNNYVSTYDGVFTYSGNKVDSLNIASAGYLRELDEEIFICYNGLFRWNKTSQTHFYNNIENNTVINNNPIGYSRDITKDAENNYYIFTNEGIFKTNLKTFVMPIDKVVNSSRIDKGEFPKLIHHYSLTNNDTERFLYYINNAFYVYYPSEEKKELISKINDKVVYATLYNNEIYFTTKSGFYKFNNGKTNKIGNNKLAIHTFVNLSKKIIVAASDFGLFKINLESWDVQNLISDEFNYLALHIKDNRVYAGGVNGVYSASNRDIMEYFSTSFENQIKEENYYYITYVFILLIIVLSFFVVKHRASLKTLNSIDLNNNLKTNINQFIIDNIEKINIEQIRIEFNISYRKLNKIYHPTSIGKHIE